MYTGDHFQMPTGPARDRHARTFTGTNSSVTETTTIYTHQVPFLQKGLSHGTINIPAWVGPQYILIHLAWVIDTAQPMHAGSSTGMASPAVQTLYITISYDEVLKVLESI